MPYTVYFNFFNFNLHKTSAGTNSFVSTITGQGAGAMLERIAESPIRTATIAAATAAAAVIAWKIYRYGKAMGDPESLEELILHESLERECKVQLGPLSAVQVFPSHTKETGSSKPISVVFIHGMWHGAWYFRALQRILADRCIGSHALNLNSGLTVGLDQHVNDVAAALKTLPQNSRIVLVGHSQGGLILQDLLHTVSDAELPEICGAVLLGTGALGQKELVNLTASSVRNSVVSSAGWLSYLRMVFTMSPPPGDVVALQAMFAHFETSEVTVTGKNISVQDYLRLLCDRPSDGWPTYVSNIAKWGNRQVPNRLGTVERLLVVQFEDDKCYPEPHTSWLLKQYAKAELLRVPGQAHCAIDRGWEETLAKPLVEWIEVFGSK